MKKFYFLFIALFVSYLSYGVTYITISNSNGCNGGGYTSLSANAGTGAFYALNHGPSQAGFSPIITVSTSEANENGAVTLSAGAWTLLKIVPGAANISVTGTANGPIIGFNGCANVTVDGTFSGGNMIFQNTTTGNTNVCVFQLINGANHVSIRNCYINAPASTTVAYTTTGLVQFSTGNPGNSNNTVTGCTFDCKSIGIPAVYSAGSSGHNNSTNTVSSCYFNNMFKTNNPSATVDIEGNSDTWTIQSNSFYLSGSLAGASTYYCIKVNNTGGGYTISQNNIGGTSNTCGGAALTLSGGNAIFYGIYISATGAAQSELELNTIKNIAITSSNTAPFYGIYIADGSIGLCYGANNPNIIGSISSSAGNQGITITNTSANASSYGIYDASTASTWIYYSKIGNITAVGSTSYSHSFYGMYIAGSGLANISYDTIGGSTSNSINASSASTSTTAQNVYGIFNHNSGGSGVSISTNTIQNLNNNYAYTSATTGGTVGIYSDNGICNITSNTISTLSSSSQSTGTAGNAASVIGIADYSSSGSGQTISSNSIHDISNSTGSARAVAIYGICFDNATGTNTLNGNFIYNLSCASDASAIISGIRANSGSASYTNNILTVGSNISNNCVIYGIYDAGVSGTNNIQFNTVDVENTHSRTANTYCLYNAANSNTRNYRNNILFNNCSGGGAGSNYSLYIVSTGGSLTCDYNQYVCYSGAILGYYGGNKSSLPFVTAQDASSVTSDPSFIYNGGTTSHSYYPKSGITGVAIGGITSDYDLNVRVSPPTIGALEGTNKWGGYTSVIFSDASNWTLDVVPSLGSDVIFVTSPVNDCYLDEDYTIGNYVNTQNSKNFYLNSKTLTLQKNFTLSGNAFLDASTGTLIMNGSSAQTIPTGAINNGQVNNFTMNNSHGVTLGTTPGDGCTLNISGTYTKTAGLLDVFTNKTTIGFNGSGQVIPASVFTSDQVYNMNNSNTVAFTGTLNIAGSLSGTYLDGITNQPTIVFNGTEGQQILPASVFFSDNIFNITLDNPDGLQINGTLNVANNLSSTSGTFDASSQSPTLGFVGSTGGQTLNSSVLASNQVYNINITNIDGVELNGNLYISGTPSVTNTGGLNSEGYSATVIFNGTSGQQVVPNHFFNNNTVYGLTINNAAGVLLSGDLFVGNNLTLGTGQLTLAGSGTTLTLANTLTNTIPNGIVANSSNLNLIGAGITIDLDQSNPGTSNAFTDVTLNSGATDYLASGETMYIDENMNEGSGGGDFSALATNTIDLAGTSAQVITYDFFTGNSVNNLTIENTSGVSLQTSDLFTVTGDFDITSNGLFILTPNQQLTVNGNTTVGAAHGFVIQSDLHKIPGSFIDNGISGSGTTDVERYMSYHNTTLSTDDHWEYFSSPITDASSDPFASLTHKVYWGQEATNDWGSYAAGDNGTLNLFIGYTRHYVLADGDVNGVTTVTGTLNTGDIGSTDNLTRTESAPGKRHGWNLMGNPYPSSLDWDAESWTKTNIISSLYYRIDDNYGVYVANSGVPGTMGATNIIPPMQAFWVRVDTTFTTGTLICHNTERVHAAQATYKTKSPNNALHLTVKNNTNNAYDDTYIVFNPNATDGFDKEYDGYKMFAASALYPQVYTNNGDNMSINSLSDLVGSRDVALGFLTTLSGTYTFTADMVSSLTANGNTVYLEDLVTSAYQDLSQNNTYQFTSAATSGFGRFILHFNPTVTNIKNVTQPNNQVLIYSNKNEVHLNSVKELNGEVQIYDMVGQLVVSKHVSGTTSDVITLNPVSAVYIVKYISSEQTTSSRIFINQ